MSDVVALVLLTTGALLAPTLSAARAYSLKRAYVRLAARWATWASPRGYTFVPGNLRITQVQSPRVQGTLSPHAAAVWTLDTMVLSPGAMPVPAAEATSTRQPYTVIAARAQTMVGAAVVVRNRQLHGHLAPPTGYRAMDLSDTLFDELCQVLTGDEHVARSLLDGRTRRALVALARRPFVFTCIEGGVWIRWPGREEEEALLDAAVEAIVGACAPRGQGGY